jgi:hypothetical protein
MPTRRHPTNANAKSGASQLVLQRVALSGTRPVLLPPERRSGCQLRSALRSQFRSHLRSPNAAILGFPARRKKWLS